MRAIASGRRGSSDLVVLFIHATAFISLLVGFSALVLVFWNAGWELGLGLMVISFFVVAVASFAIALLVGGDNFFVQFIATLGLWPLGYFLIRETLTSFPQ